MKSEKTNVKVTFYLKKKNVRNGLCPVMGRITVNKERVQFSCRLNADPSLWNVRSGRVIGKSRHAGEVNSQIDRINAAITAKFNEIVLLRGTAAAEEVKNAFLGISSSGEMLLEMFHEHNRKFKMRTGIDCSFET